MKEHPAKFSPSVLATIQRKLEVHVKAGGRVLDPFAGVGGVHRLEGYRITGVELEREWADEHPDTQQGDALDLPFRRGTFHAVVTSPCFGNRMADHHHARDKSKRHTYRHVLGRELSPGSAAVLQWGPAYQDFHCLAISEATRVCKKTATWVLNISDHWRDGHIACVSGWWAEAMAAYGWEWVDAEPVITPRQRNGANAELRMHNEWVLVFTRGEPLTLAA